MTTAPFSKPSNQNAQIKVTPEMMRNFKTLICDCGGMLFESGIVFKKISSIVSPSGQEELYPLEVLVCKTCGKVPHELNIGKMLPDEVLAQKPIIK